MRKCSFRHSSLHLMEVNYIWQRNHPCYFHDSFIYDFSDLIVSSEAICGISSLLCLTVDRMPWNNEKRTQRIAILLSRLLALSWSHREINSGAVKLLKALFRLHVRDNMERNEDDGESTIVNIVQEAWTKGLYEISKRINQTAFAEHVKYFASIIWEKIFLT